MARKPSILFVDDDESVRLTLSQVLISFGFSVTSAATVPEGLALITRRKFDVLVADLNIGSPADGFILVSAMRRTQPSAVTLILTGYPALETALEAIRQQVDDYIVKPADTRELVNKIKAKLAKRERPLRQVEAKRLPIVILENRELIIQGWLAAVKSDPELSSIKIDESERVDGIPQVLEIAVRLSYGTQISAQEMKAATIHGRTRRRHGYTVPLLIREGRLLQTSIAQCIQANLLSIALSHLITDLIQMFAAINILLEESARELLDERTLPEALKRRRSG
jgi:DNA-binding response OmpR family regulator